MLAVWRDWQIDPENEATRELGYEFGAIRTRPGQVGWAPYLALCRAELWRKSDASRRGTWLIAGGLLAKHGYSLRVEAWPALDPNRVGELERALELAFHYSGAERDPQWTKAEIEVFWQRHAVGAKLAKVARTKHFLILAGSYKGAGIGKQLEALYERTRELVTFEELPLRRLLPVLVFESQGDFTKCCAQQRNETLAEAAKRTGLATDELYATSEDEHDEYERGLEVAKLLLISRAHVWGGALWFRSGLREWVAQPKSAIREASAAVKQSGHTPIARLLRWDQSEGSAVPGDEEGEVDFWQQSALWIEFLRTSPTYGKSFQRFVHAVGALPEGDAEAVELALQTIFGVDLATLEKHWLEFVD